VTRTPRVGVAQLLDCGSWVWTLDDEQSVSLFLGYAPQSQVKEPGAITLSTDLVKAPLLCIKYVTTHKLCYPLVHHRSRASFSLLSRCMPGLRRSEDRLESSAR
jgi:hypothetical protein